MEHEAFYMDVHFWYEVAFVLFFVLAGKILWKAITGWIDSKIGRVKSDIDEAAMLRAEAETLLQEAKARHEAATIEASEIIARANAEAETLVKKTQDETENLIARREQQVTERIVQAEKQALADIQAQTVELAMNMAREMLAKDMSPEARNKLATSAIADITKAA